MENQGKKVIIGVLGGIGSGKSTVAGAFEKLGCKTIYADRIAHEILNEPFTKSEVLKAFGGEISGSGGEIDRQKLGQIVFHDPEKLAKLNSIVHPRVMERVEELIGQYQKDEYVKAIVLDIPLLAEVNWDKKCDRLVFVDCDIETRATRTEGKFSKEEIKKRENFQIPLDKKKELADNIINNNSDFSALCTQVAEIFSEIVRN